MTSRTAPKSPVGKRAYRYEVTGSEGSGATAIGDSPFILDWTYFGRSYTWQIFDRKAGKCTGWISGKYVDKGYVDGTYKSDAELAAVPSQDSEQ